MQVAPFIDEEGRQVTPGAGDRLRHARHRRRQPDQRLRHARRARSTPSRSRRADEAARFHRRLVNACIRAHTQTEPLRPEQLQVAIIGAGATGTELAAELHKTTRQLVAYGLDRIDPDKDIKINLIEAAPRILPQLPERLAKAAAQAARRAQGARAHRRAGRGGAGATASGSPTARCIPAELVVWAAGVKAPDVLEGHRRARDQPPQPAGGAPDAADDARRRHLRHRRLRRLPLARPSDAGAAARAGGAPAGLAPGARSCRGAWRASRFSRGATAISARWCRSAHYSTVGNLMGKLDRRQSLRRGPVRRPDVQVALQDAPAGPARRHQGRARHARPPHHPPHRAAREAALTRDPAGSSRQARVSWLFMAETEGFEPSIRLDSV